MIPDIFKNRSLVISTMHRKEQVIQPILEAELGVRCLLPPSDLDTDILGTFSGETERKYDPVTTLRMKCELGLQLTGCDLALASEGSFGQHPHLFFAMANEEIVMLKDSRNDVEITGRYLTTETNYDSLDVNTVQEAIAFAKRNLFPSHGMILKVNQGDQLILEKGITEADRLSSLSKELLRQNGTIRIETDMRALYNPTRMLAIEKATENLIRTINSLCPTCGHPGFQVTAVISGLPCSYCGLPTRSTHSHRYSCIKCTYGEERKFPHSRETEDPMYCDFCNP